MQIRLQVIQNRMAKKHKSYQGEATLDLGFDEMDAVSQQETGPVTVLGMTFSNDEERRAYFREQLRAKLPELRNIEGFPIGSDDDIVNLSDPPYYTACPNPWLNDFIAEWEQEKLQLEAEGKRQPNVVVNEPYAADVSEGKNNPIYMAHAYHTKVPHPAIMRYLLHYTQPGDIVYDGFCGTGMTGVAAQLCNSSVDAAAITSKRQAIGTRHAICSDLSPIASLISASYLLNFDPKQFEQKANAILEQVESELGWLFETRVNGKPARINYTIWSDVFQCPSCGSEINLWEQTVNLEQETILSEFDCPCCGARCSKKNLLKYQESYFDTLLNKTVSINKKAPVRVNYYSSVGKGEIDVTDFDFDILEKAKTVSLELHTNPIPSGDEVSRNEKSGITHFHQFYSLRSFLYLSRVNQLVKGDPHLQAWFTSVLLNTSKMYKFRLDRKGSMLYGTYFIPSLNIEYNPYKPLKGKIRDFIATYYSSRSNAAISVSSATCNPLIKSESIDYIFTDPPFGSNLMYSELSSIWEGWLNVLTNNNSEAVISGTQGKGLFEYQSLMENAFKEYFRVLKPGKWMTVEFSNTSASVWNTIQTSLQNVGFVVANVSALDKKQGSFKAVTTTTAVKQDLIISCFKPTEQLLYKFENEASETNVWDFIDELLSRLPVHLEHSNKTTAVVERSPKILYDRLISFYVQHGFPVPLNAQEFQAGLRERYAERDGMYFTPSQAAKYDELRKRTDGFQASLFFVDSEQGGIAWLNNELSSPQTYQDLQPKWMQAINGVRKGDILPELMQILEENFIKESDGKWRKPNLQDDVDLAALRHKALMREFKVYVEVAQKPRGKIKEARVEALRAGFKQCYQDKDFATIVAVGDRIPQNLLTEDEQLLQFYEIAVGRV